MEAILLAVLVLVVLAPVWWRAWRRFSGLPPLPGPRIQLDDGDGNRWGLR